MNLGVCLNKNGGGRTSFKLGNGVSKISTIWIMTPIKYCWMRKAKDGWNWWIIKKINRENNIKQFYELRTFSYPFQILIAAKPRVLEGISWKELSKSSTNIYHRFQLNPSKWKRYMKSVNFVDIRRRIGIHYLSRSLKASVEVTISLQLSNVILYTRAIHHSVHREIPISSYYRTHVSNMVFIIRLNFYRKTDSNSSYPYFLYYGGKLQQVSRTA